MEVDVVQPETELLKVGLQHMYTSISKETHLGETGQLAAQRLRSDDVHLGPLDGGQSE